MPHLVELTVERLGQLGEGVGHFKERTVFIPGAFPGERVEVALEEGGKVLRGEVRRILQPSPERRPSTCCMGASCGGCDWIELAEPAQRRAKQEILLSTLEHLGRISRDDLTVRPLLAASPDFGYRRRAVLHFRKGKLGFFARRSHEHRAVEHCGALVDPLSTLPGRLGAHLKPLAADAEEVHLLAEGEAVAFAVFLTGAVASRHVQASEAAVRALRVKGAVLVPREGSVRLVGKPVLRSDNPLRPEVPLYLRPDAFSQAHAGGNQGLVGAAVMDLASREADRVLELYAGNGNFTFALAALSATVTAVESSRVSLELAQRSAQEGQVRNVRFIQGDAGKVCEGLAKEGRAFELLLADPPRTGAPGLARWARALGVRRVVYVACDPASLARDAASLSGEGYAPVSVQGVDMFPQTHHIEAVMTFARKEQG